MAINNIPASLQAAIQQNFLEREFLAGLQSALGYRRIADREKVAINVGETVTKTRFGYKAPTTTPLIAANNTNLDNGMTRSANTIEQYTLGINMYGDSIDLNVVTSQVGIANQFLMNGKVNGMQARQSLDRLARNALFATYLGGNTSVRTTLGAAGVNVNVDNINCFGQVLVNGVMVPVSATNNVPGVLVNGTASTLTGVAADATNVSVTPGGVSGVLTFAANVTIANGTAGNAVVHPYAPSLFRTNGRATSLALTSSDQLVLGNLEDALAALRNNTGYQGEVDVFMDNVSMRQLFNDTQFQLLWRGQYGSAEVKNMKFFNVLGMNFIATTEALVQNNAGVNIRRPIMAMPGALVEGDFAGMREKASDFYQNAEITMADDVCHVTRGPLDRLQQIVSQSWFWIGGFVAPTDVTATTSIIPTAGNQYWKRAIVVEHGS